MPVTIYKRGSKPAPEPVQAPPAKPLPVVAPTVQTGLPERPKLLKTVHVGKSDILPDMDLHDVPGRTKFLVNIHKVENGLPIWYRIIGYDEDTHQTKLRSRHKNTFSTKVNPDEVVHHYMVVMQDEGTTEPTPEAFSEIRKLVAAVDPIKVLPGTFKGHLVEQKEAAAVVEKAPEPKKAAPKKATKK